MAEGVKIEIVSPERLLVSQDVRSVTIPGSDGYFTVLGEHAPLMTTLKPGFVTAIDLSGATQAFYVRGGFADVSAEGVTILAEESSALADFDRSVIDRELAAAQENLARAESLDDKGQAQDVVHAWLNLMTEADQIA